LKYQGRTEDATYHVLFEKCDDIFDLPYGWARGAFGAWVGDVVRKPDFALVINWRGPLLGFTEMGKTMPTL
jgi:hypothetical protein